MLLPEKEVKVLRIYTEKNLLKKAVLTEVMVDEEDTYILWAIKDCGPYFT
jgi:hypothetical protein